MGIPAIYVVDSATGTFERFVTGALKAEGDFNLAEPDLALSFSEIATLVR